MSCVSGNSGRAVFQIDHCARPIPYEKAKSAVFVNELSENDKNGSWFVMTNKIKQHYLKQKFKSSDAITISYISGKDLSKRVDEKVYSLSNNLFSNSTYRKHVIGNVNNNSEISFSVYLKSLKGIELVETPGKFYFRPRRCHNCTGTNWSVSAEFVTNSFQPFEREWHVEELSDIDGSIKVLINNTELDLIDLIKRNLATVELKESNGEQFVHYTFSRLHELDILQSGSANIVFIKLSPHSVGHAGEGLQINKVGGHNIDRVHNAGYICLEEAFKRKVKLATTSWKFSEWEKKVPWGRPDPRTGWKPLKGQKKKYWDGVVVDIVSTIINNFN